MTWVLEAIVVSSPILAVFAMVLHWWWRDE